MGYLIIVSFVWAFSFGLIKGALHGLDPNFVAMIRMLLSLLIFIPACRVRSIPIRVRVQLLLTGMIQYGLMYSTYISAYQYLAAYQVALLTIFTPLYVTLFHDLISRRFHRMFLITAALTVLGTGVILWQDGYGGPAIRGILLMQISNMSFAFGQIAYRRVMDRLPNTGNLQVFAWLYLGAVIITGIGAVFTASMDTIRITPQQMAVLAYLGILASGICFFLWNAGARRVNAGTLAVSNNMKIPLAVACSILFFGETANIPRLVTGGMIILIALSANEWIARGTARPGGGAPAGVFCKDAGVSA